MVRMGAMAVAVLSALTLARWPSIARFGLLLSSGLAIAVVWTSVHAGATEGWPGTAHRLSDIVHMLAAAVWLAASPPFHGCCFGPPLLGRYILK
jgi:putative copper resistance protein D